MTTKMSRKIVLTVCIITVVLSLLCLIWSAYAAADYQQTIVKMSNENLAIDVSKGLNFFYSLYICVSIFSTCIVLGCVFIFIYLLKNDFSLSKEERDQLSLQRQQQRKQQKREKLKKKLEEIEEL